MENLKIKVDNREITLGVNDKICNGFYIVEEASTVEKNNKLLGIEFESTATNSEPQHRITKVAEYSFVTTKAGHGYLQHIILPSIDKNGFDAYVNSLQFPEVQQMLLSAFGLKGTITLGSI